MFTAVLMAASALVTTAQPVAAATFTVNRIGDASDRNLANAACDTSTNAGSQCTLRAAIQEANDTPGADVIRFNITSASKVIAPRSPLPPITGRVTINGYSQPGASVNTRAVGNNAVLRIVLDGVDAGAAAVGLDIEANNSTIRGLVIQRWAGAGVEVAGTGNTISGNFIGTNAAGNAARANGRGIVVRGSGHVIGGAARSARNLVSGNGSSGIRLFDVSGVLIAGNYVGTNAAGTTGLQNGDTGVHFEGGSVNVIGSGTGGAPNLISGNEQEGLKLDGTSNSRVLGNLIGTDATGTAGIGNGQDGIGLISADANTIGGTTAAQRNTVSDNQVGIALENSDGNTVAGNRLGTKANGTGNLGNRFGGISISGSDNQIGGASGAGNVIANTVNGSGIFISQNNLPIDTLIQNNAITGNAQHGINVESGPTRILGNLIQGNGNAGIQVFRFASSPTGIRISGNLTAGNGGLGIDLLRLPATANGVEPNDAGDGDGGPNRTQNFPVISAALRQANGLTTVVMSLNSTPSTEFRVELFLAAPDTSGHGEGQLMLAAANITTNASGNRGFSFQIGGLAVGQQLTATAINESTDDTSEFGQNQVVTPAP